MSTDVVSEFISLAIDNYENGGHSSTKEKEHRYHELKQRFNQNEDLREVIVDTADFWDGKESIKYGLRLYNILKKLGINDIPSFYKKENIDRLITELEESRKEKGRT